MKSVYVETSILSYLTSQPSRDLLAAAHQQITKDWWEGQRGKFEIFVSPLVDQEARRGDQSAAQRRVETLRGLPMLEIIDDAYELAAALIKGSALPPSAGNDALHISLAAVHGINYLLTWNCRHIDNAQRKPVIRSICAAQGYQCPEICTPEELMGDEREY